MEPILQITNLGVEYYRLKKTIPAVRDVSLSIHFGESVAIVGESGCGKTTLGLSVLNLISSQEGKIVRGEIKFISPGNGTLHELDLLSIPHEKLRAIRGKEISMIFQDPFTSLNPVISVGQQLTETITVHFPELKDTEVKEKILLMLNAVQLTEPEQIYCSFPHQLSGGMQQRVMIAMALLTQPKILIADEPTTALDVTVQQEILDLLVTLRQNYNLTLILITHNLGIVSRVCSRLAIMYAGVLVEVSMVPDFFTRPLHPYSQGLVNSLPELNLDRDRLPSIPGQVPDVLNLPPGCKFYPRCPKKMPKCNVSEPPLFTYKNRLVRCYLYEDNAARPA